MIIRCYFCNRVLEYSADEYGAILVKPCFMCPGTKYKYDKKIKSANQMTKKEWEESIETSISNIIKKIKESN